MNSGRDNNRPGLQYSEEARLHNNLRKLLRQPVVDEAAIISLLEVDEAILKKLITNMIDVLRASVRPNERDWRTNALQLGTIDGADALEAVMKFADEKSVVKVLAGMDEKTLAWLKQYVIADDAAEKVLVGAIKRKKNSGLHEIREAWMHRRNTDPLSRKDESEKECFPKRNSSDPGPRRK